MFIAPRIYQLSSRPRLLDNERHSGRPADRLARSVKVNLLANYREKSVKTVYYNIIELYSKIVLVRTLTNTLNILYSLAQILAVHW